MIWVVTLGISMTAVILPALKAVMKAGRSLGGKPRGKTAPATSAGRRFVICELKMALYTGKHTAAPKVLMQRMRPLLVDISATGTPN